MKILKYFLICIFSGLLLIIFLNFFIDSDGIDKKYSTYNNDLDGCKILYLLTERLGYNVNRYEKSSLLLENDGIMVLFDPVKSVIEENEENKNLKKWIKKGNVIILFDEKDTYNLLDGIISEKSDKGKSVFKCGNGFIIVFNSPNELINSNLKNNKKIEDYIECIDNYSANNKVFKNIIFNEFYLYEDKSGVKIGDIVNIVFKLVCIQLFIALIVWVLMKSRRFGQIEESFEVIKRQENENLYALSNIYKKSKLYYINCEVSFNQLLFDVSKYLGISKDLMTDIDLIKEEASKNSILIKNDFINILNDCERAIKNKNLSKSKMIELIKKIDLLRKVIK